MSVKRVCGFSVLIFALICFLFYCFEVIDEKRVVK